MYDKTGTIIDCREMLRVKFNSLMAEAGIIRKEENRLKYVKVPKKHRKMVPTQGGVAAHIPKRERRPVPCPMLLLELQQHRIKTVRYHARLTHLALGFIKGRSLLQMENYPTKERMLMQGHWAAIEAMVKKYGSAEALATVRAQYALYFGKLYAVKPPFVKKERKMRAVDESKRETQGDVRKVIA